METVARKAGGVKLVPLLISFAPLESYHYEKRKH